MCFVFGMFRTLLYHASLHHCIPTFHPEAEGYNTTSHNTQHSKWPTDGVYLWASVRVNPLSLSLSSYRHN